MNLFYITKVIFSFFIFVFLSLPSLFAQGVWTQKANFGGTVRREAVGFSIGTKGYIGTGAELVGFNFIFHSDFWEWDQASDTWSQKADFGGGGRIAAVGFSIGGKGYIGTGADDSIGARNDFWEYDTTGNSWTQKANLSGSARYYAVGFSIGTKGYIGTGRDSVGAYSNDFWEYDPLADTWLQKANFGGTPREHPAGFSIGTKGYVGTGVNAVLCNDFWEYNPVTDFWTQKTSFPGPPSEGGVAFSIGTKGYIATGYDNTFMTDLWEYNPANDSWMQKSDITAAGRHGAVGFSIGTKGYVGTGGDISFAYFNDFWEYDPTLDGISENQNNYSVSIYPNPMISNATLIISGAETMNSGNFKLFDGNGKLVREFNIVSEIFLIERNNLSSGIYFYQISSEQKTITTGKLIVE